MPTLFGLRGERLQTAMSFAVVIPAFLAMGFSLSFLGGVVGYQPFYAQFPKINTATTTGELKKHNALIQGVTVSTLNLGAILGCFSVMYLGNKLGRRKTTFVGAVVTLVGTVLQCSAFSIAQLIVGRLVLGAGLGMMSSTVPVWQSETSKTSKRGHHVIVGGVMIACGVAVASWITYGFSKINTTESFKWRVPSMTTGILALVVMAFTFFFPESPRWLVLKGRVEDARCNIAIYDDLPVDSEPVEAALAGIVTMHDQAMATASFGQLFKMGNEKMLYRLILASVTQLWSQMGGSGLITYYAEQLFSNIGLDHDTSRLLAATDLTWKALCSFIPFFVLERFGRRKLFMFSGAGMASCLLALAVCGSQTSDSNKIPARVGVFFVYAFVFFYPFGFLGTNWLYSQEVISTPYRAPASGVSTAVHWLAAFVVALTTPLGFQTLSWKFYFVWMAVAASIIPGVYFFFPETTGLSMEEIDVMFRETPSIFATTRVSREMRREKFESMATITGKGEAGRVESFDNAEKTRAEREQIERAQGFVDGERERQ